MLLILYYKDMLKKGNDATNLAILSFFFVTKRTKLNASHACEVKKFRLNANLISRNYGYFPRVTH